MDINKKEIKDPILRRLNEFMSKKFISQTEIVNKIEVPQSTISGYFRDDRTPNIAIVVKILTKYSYLSADWLLLGFGEIERKESIKITDENKSMPNRFEELIRENERQKIKISNLENKIESLKKEKNIRHEYTSYVVETEAELKYKNNHENIIP